jgi:hypothetical protein
MIDFSRKILPVMSALLMVAACAGPEPTPPPQRPVPPPTQPPPPPPAMSSAEPAPPPPVLPPVELVEGTPAEDPAKAPTVSVIAPFPNQVIRAKQLDDFRVKMKVKGWDAPSDNKHIHVILDNRPYYRLNTPNEPFKLKDIDPSYEIKEGFHLLVAFPSRHSHEAVKPIKKASPLVMVPFFVGKRDGTKWKAKEPMFIYSRPKGKNTPPFPADGVLVDYYLNSAELKDGGYNLKITLKGPGVENGVTVTAKAWKPWRIKNPRDGQYTITMQLVDKDGKVVPGAWNDTTRQFDVSTKAPEEPPPPPPPASSAK